MRMATVLSTPLFAKGDLLKITMCADSAAPIEISGPGLAAFDVWAGPGVRSNGIEETEGFIIDWTNGIVSSPPTGLIHYDVFFYSNFRKKDGSIIYTVSYDFDTHSGVGYVYLPGRGDSVFQTYNMGTMWHGHGLEGHWFKASAKWNSFVRPWIDKAPER
jgi:hypothetical protein